MVDEPSMTIEQRLRRIEHRHRLLMAMFANVLGAHAAENPDGYEESLIESEEELLARILGDDGSSAFDDAERRDIEREMKLLMDAARRHRQRWTARRRRS